MHLPKIELIKDSVLFVQAVLAVEHSRSLFRFFPCDVHPIVYHREREPSLKKHVNSLQYDETSVSCGHSQTL